MTSALQKFVKAFVNNRGKIAIVPNEAHAPGIFVPLEQSLVDKLRAVANPMTAEHFVKKWRARWRSAPATRSTSASRATRQPWFTPFVSFMAEPQTDSHRRVIQALLQDLFSRSESEQEES